MKNIKWIFFDIGSTIMDETEAWNHRIRDMIKGTTVSFTDFDRVRTELAAQGFDGNSEAIQYFGLKKTPWHTEDEVPYPDVKETLFCLARQGYKLGVLANQIPGTAARLKHWGLHEYLSLIIASAEVGVAKPNPAIFQLALDMAACQPEEAIMVGDRLDNDMLPAKVLGITTVWIRNGLSQYQSPSLGFGIADYQINHLHVLVDLLKQ